MLEHLDTVIGFATVMLLLSLLVTTVVQMVAALSNLRGKCLLEGTEQLLKQLDPGLSDQARELGRKVLTHSAIGEKAASLRDLLPGKLRRIAENLPRELAVAIRPKELILVLQDLSKDPTVEEAVRNKLEALFTSTPGQGSPEMAAKAEELLKKLEGQFPNQAQDLKSAVESVLGTSQTIVVKVDAWFDTVMDRTSEVFKYYTRQITVVVAVLLALLLHVDSLSILDQLSQDEDLRARLVQMSDTAQEDARRVRELQNADLSTQALTQAQLKNLNLSLQTLQKHLGETQLKIIPNPYSWRFNGWRNFLGVVMTAFFLSLGAPFWYNALRKLSDLRPIVARRVDEPTEKK